MAKTRIRWRVRAFEEIRRSPGVDALLAKEVDRVVAQVGDGYASGVEPGKTRSRGYVVTASPEALRDNSENQTLLRALAMGAVDE